MEKNHVQKKFSRNNLIIMALGNIIGSGIFLGSGISISLAGPAAILAYIFGGIIMTLEVMFITEMSIINPDPGSFRVHATEIFGPWIGFVNGWMFWVSGVLGMASEVAAAAIFTKLWLPDIPLWIFCIIYAVIMTIINLSDVKGLSRIESWLASIKVVALALIILIGILAAIGILPSGTMKVHNIFNSVQSFLPNGVGGIAASMIMVMFSFIGTGIIGLSIAESEKPERDAPPAIRTITSTVMILYCFSIFFIVLFIPWSSVSSTTSPFIPILQNIGIPYGSDILNFIVLTASLSGLNSAMYSASRMLSSLSRDGEGPKLFIKTNKNGVPIYALALNSVVLMLTAVLSYVLPSHVFIVLAGATGFTALVNWLTITITHYFYRKKTLREHPEKLKYKVKWYPYTTIIAFLMIALIFATSFLYPEQIPGLMASVVLFLALLIIYFALKSIKSARSNNKLNKTK